MDPLTEDDCEGMLHGISQCEDDSYGNDCDWKLHGISQCLDGCKQVILRRRIHNLLITLEKIVKQIFPIRITRLYQF